MKAKYLYNLIIKFRESNEGKYPHHGFISVEDYHTLFNDRDVFNYSRGVMDFKEKPEDFDFAGVLFYVCNNPNTPLSLVGDWL